MKNCLAVTFFIPTPKVFFNPAKILQTTDIERLSAASSSIFRTAYLLHKILVLKDTRILLRENIIHQQCCALSFQSSLLAFF